MGTLREQGTTSIDAVFADAGVLYGGKKVQESSIDTTSHDFQVNVLGRAVDPTASRRRSPQGQYNRSACVHNHVLNHWLIQLSRGLGESQQHCEPLWRIQSNTRLVREACIFRGAVVDQLRVLSRPCGYGSDKRDT